MVFGDLGVDFSVLNLLVYKLPISGSVLYMVLLAPEVSNL